MKTRAFARITICLLNFGSSSSGCRDRHAIRDVSLREVRTGDSRRRLPRFEDGRAGKTPEWEKIHPAESGPLRGGLDARRYSEETPAAASTNGGVAGSPGRGRRPEDSAHR